MIAALAREELIEQAQGGDDGAMERLLVENSKLIWSVARRYFGRGIENDDLYQLGSIGFIKAVRGFSKEFETQFSTYAVPKIAGEIRRFMRDDGLVKVSRSLKENQMKINICRARLQASLGREPYLSELEAETGICAEDIASCETATRDALSLNAEIGDDGFRLMDICPAPDCEENMVESLAVKKALSELPDKERAVIALRYFRDLTQQKTAVILNISQVQVSRIERRAIEKIRAILAE